MVSGPIWSRYHSFFDCGCGDRAIGARGIVFLGGEYDLSNPSDYEEVLLEQFVIADPDKREKLIIEQINELRMKRIG